MAFDVDSLSLSGTSGLADPDSFARARVAYGDAVWALVSAEDFDGAWFPRAQAAVIAGDLAVPLAAVDDELGRSGRLLVPLLSLGAVHNRRTAAVQDEVLASEVGSASAPENLTAACLRAVRRVGDGEWHARVLDSALVCAAADHDEPDEVLAVTLLAIAASVVQHHAVCTVPEPENLGFREALDWYAAHPDDGGAAMRATLFGTSRAAGINLVEVTGVGSIVHRLLVALDLATIAPGDLAFTLPWLKADAASAPVALAALDVAARADRVALRAGFDICDEDPGELRSACLWDLEELPEVIGDALALVEVVRPAASAGRPVSVAEFAAAVRSSASMASESGELADVLCDTALYTAALAVTWAAEQVQRPSLEVLGECVAAAALPGPSPAPGVRLSRPWER